MVAAQQACEQQAMQEAAMMQQQQPMQPFAIMDGRGY